ncbi:hypothetical protein ACJRO7_001250 [Eucalyptus globulus]|uniref:Uncharacterized protein n=1 Tax=Eucalyptus globulus TaxID=34317 RepID=A0ABD3LRH2_EUCGL
MAAGAATNGRSRGKEGGPSLNSLALMRNATTPANISSVDVKDWRCVVSEGVLLKNNTQKFWVEDKLHKNCFLVLPKACDIAGDDEESCWSWITKEEKCFRSTVDILVPKSKKSSCLLIQGRFDTRALSPNTTYEVAFVVQLAGTNPEWYSPAKLELDLPDGTKHTRTEDPLQMPVYEWRKLRAGEFMMGPKTVGKICFSLQGRLDPEKTGFILKGVLIHPKDSAKQ